MDWEEGRSGAEVKAQYAVDALRSGYGQALTEAKTDTLKHRRGRGKKNPLPLLPHGEWGRRGGEHLHRKRAEWAG